MSLRRIASSLLALTLGTGIALTAGGGGAAASAPPEPYRDYLSSPTQTQFGASGADQCGLPTSEREGNWVCFDDDDSVQPRYTQNCIQAGCWYRYDDYSADFGSSFATWGVGTTVLGMMQYYVKWQLAGAQTWSRDISYENSVDTQNVVFTGDLLDAAPSAAGSPISGAANLNVVGSVPAHSLASWDPNGYKSYDNNSWDHTQVLQMSWNYSGYSGYWYTYIKSICTHTDDKEVYKFREAYQLPADPIGAGYHP